MPCSRSAGAFNLDTHEFIPGAEYDLLKLFKLPRVFAGYCWKHCMEYTEYHHWYVIDHE